MLLAARCKYRTQKSRQKSPSGHHRTTSTGYIFETKARIDNRKNLLSSNISYRCPHNMVNFGPLAAEIVSLVWGTPANFNGFRVLAALLYGTLVGVSQTAAFNRGRHLYSTGRPSGWALAPISSSLCTAATRLRCGGTFNGDFVTNLLLNLKQGERILQSGQRLTKLQPRE